MADLAKEAAELWLKQLEKPVHSEIKKIGSMQRKFTIKDWSDYMWRIKQDG